MYMWLQICFSHGVYYCEMKTMLVAKSAETPKQSFHERFHLLSAIVTFSSGT